MTARTEALLWPLGLAALMTAANAFKPVTVDDAAYLLYARQVTESPLDPYGFRLIWYQQPQPAFEVLAPPLVPYCWAAGVGLLADSVPLWKLWLSPFAILFTCGLAALLRRFAARRWRALLAMTALSPAFLPAVNLMLDVPALGLMLCGVAAGLAANDRRSWPLAAAAGLLIGVGTQAKYTALMGVPVVLLDGVLRRRATAGLTATMALGVFAGWEAWVAGAYGESHFLHHLRAAGERGGWAEKRKLIAPLFGHVGGLLPAVGLVAWAGVGVGRRGLALAAGGVLAGLALIAAVPADSAVLARADSGAPRLEINGLVFGASAAVTAAGLGSAGWCLGFRRAGLRPSAADWFLILWFWGEVLGYFALSPFPAARRVMGLAVAGTLLAGRLASLRGADIRPAVGLSVLLGAGYAAVDFADARVEKRAAEWAAEAAAGDCGTVWYCGHWGFQFYAERAGMRPVLPGETVIRPGDRLVVPEGPRPDAQQVEMPASAELVARRDFATGLPLRTVSEYYAGKTPLARADRAVVRVAVWRAAGPAKLVGP